MITNTTIKIMECGINPEYMDVLLLLVSAPEPISREEKASGEFCLFSWLRTLSTVA